MAEYISVGDLARVGQISDDADDFTPWVRTPLYALQGVGQVTDPKAVAFKIRGLLDPKRVIVFVEKHMKEQAKRLRQKHALMDKQLREAGLLPTGSMGHVMTKWEAIKTGEPWEWSPGATHNKKHETGGFVVLKNYSAGDIALVKGRGMSDYEVQHLDPGKFNVHLKAAKAGIRPPPGVEPLESPSESATEALQESVGGQLIVYGEDAVEVAKRIARKAADAAKTALGLFTKVLPYLPYIAVGVVGLVALPYVLGAVKTAKRLKRRTA